MSVQNPIVAVYTRSGYPASDVKQSVANYANTNVNTIILSGPNGLNGGIVYNDPPYTMFNAQGQYVGDPKWPDSLQTLIAQTNIAANGVYFSLSNSAISALAAMAAADLAQVMTWLKANGITGIDMDCENWGQSGGLNPMDPACQTVTLAAIQAGLALTAAPYNAQSGWQSWCSFVPQNGGVVSWLNLQCYAGGYGNDPVTWSALFQPAVPIVAGFEASPGPDGGALTPAQAQAQLASWQAETPPNTVAGAFVWEYSIIESGAYTVSDYALAMYAGLTGQQNTVTVTACDNELIIIAFQSNASYELARIESGFSNPVSVTLNIAAGEYKEPVRLSGLAGALDVTTTVVLPSGDYQLMLSGINWAGGATQFSTIVNGVALDLPFNDTAPMGMVWTPALQPITV